MRPQLGAPGRDVLGVSRIVEKAAWFPIFIVLSLPCTAVPATNKAGIMLLLNIFRHLLCSTCHWLIFWYDEMKVA